MRTLGVDLAAQDSDTALCAIDWVPDRALVQLPVVGSDDDAVVEAMGSADWIGIDAPFGWPDTMVEAVHGYAKGDPWPTTAVSMTLRYRATDWFVHNTIAEERGVSVWPLSVSSNWIAFCAWRCAGLLSRYSAVNAWTLDRIGAVAPSGVVEVYPAGALALWGFHHKGYKGATKAKAQDARDKRDAIMAELQNAAGAWLTLSDEVREACIANDDAFDAFVSSLVARAAAIGSTLMPPVEHLGAARREGWIHLPGPHSIGGLATAVL
jgi:predicted nuclease with RNAse H fold